MPFLLTLALLFVPGAFIHLHIPTPLSFIPNFTFLLSWFIQPPWSLVNVFSTEKHIFGGRDGEGPEMLLLSPKQPSDEVLAVGEEMPPGRGTFAGHCRTSMMVQKRPGLETRLQHGYKVHPGDGDRTRGRCSYYICQGPSSRQGWRQGHNLSPVAIMRPETELEANYTQHRSKVHPGDGWR